MKYVIYEYQTDGKPMQSAQEDIYQCFCGAVQITNEVAAVCW